MFSLLLLTDFSAPPFSLLQAILPLASATCCAWEFCRGDLSARNICDYRDSAVLIGQMQKVVNIINVLAAMPCLSCSEGSFDFIFPPVFL